MEEIYFYNGRQIKTIIHRFTLNNIEFVVVDDGEDWNVCRLENLKLFKDTWQYKKEQEALDTLNKIKLEKDKLVNEIKESAIKSLEATLRINSAFSQDGKMGRVGIYFAEKLKELITKKKL